jgi:hypothetical protein
VTPSREKKTWNKTVSATINYTGLKSRKKVPTGIRLTATSATSAAATKRSPTVESMRNSPTTNTAVAIILALGSSACTGEDTG